MKKFVTVLFIVLFLGCGNRDTSRSSNAFYVNGNYRVKVFAGETLANQYDDCYHYRRINNNYKLWTKNGIVEVSAIAGTVIIEEINTDD